VPRTLDRSAADSTSIGIDKAVTTASAARAQPPRSRAGRATPGLEGRGVDPGNRSHAQAAVGEQSQVSAALARRKIELSQFSTGAISLQLPQDYVRLRQVSNHALHGTRKAAGRDVLQNGDARENRISGRHQHRQILHEETAVL